jgi:hypothetical protein
MPSSSSRLQYLPCAGSGKMFVAPGVPVVAVAYNGIWLRRGTAFIETGGIITLSFSIEEEDLIYALCVA